MRKVVALILAVLLLSSAFAVGAYSPKLKLFYNGNQLETEFPLQIVNEHLYLPVEIFKELLGITVDWDEEYNTVHVESTERAVLTAQIQRLEEALTPKEPRDVVETWAEGVKMRNGALQYAMLSTALKKETYDYFAGLNWSTGTSSPWVESFRVTENYRVDEDKYRYTVEFNYRDATKNDTYAKTYVTVGKEEDKWVVSALEQIEVGGEITQLTLEDDGKVKAVFVVGEKTVYGGYDQANVVISPETKIYKGYTDLALTVGALQKGVSVEVTLTADPRNMIYPVTAEAKSIRVFEAQETDALVYVNTEYGFTLCLPAGWQDYKVITEEWQGLSLEDGKDGKVVAKGPFLKIRHPQWTKEELRQDIPIMVLTLDQWADLQAMKFSVGAAPIGPRELERNDKYVFALPARYNYAFPDGYEEVDAILANNALEPLAQENKDRK